MAANNEERRYQYYVPENYTNSARLFGFLRTRNAVEMVLIAGGLALLEATLIDASIKTIATVIIVTAVPLAVLLAIGLEGCSVTEYLQRMIKAYADRKYIVKKEAHYGIEAEAQFARAECKQRKRKEKKQRE